MSLQNCFPYKLLNTHHGLLSGWLDMRDVPFTDPFFEESIAKSLKSPVNSRAYRQVSSLDMLEPWAETIDSIEPTAFIFHVSRCGSTLLCQLLNLDDQNLCLSEVPFFDEILRLPLKTPGYDRGHSQRHLKAAINIYGQKRFHEQRRLFIKTDSWHTAFYEDLRQMYPGIPFIFLYRHPLEVLYSHQKLRGMQSVPGLIEPEVFQLRPETAASMLPDEYLARVLEFYFRRFLEISGRDPDTLFLNYSLGSEALFAATYKMLNIVSDATQNRAVTERSKYHSKHPGEKFDEPRRASAPPAMLKGAVSLYHELENSLSQT